MKRFISIAFLAMVSLTSFGFISNNTNADDNSVYPVIIAFIMIVGGISARLIAIRKSANQAK
jgi:hypothetical protein